MIAVLHAIAIGLFCVTGLAVLYRVVRGPGILDRMIATDVLLTTFVLMVGTYMVLSGTTLLIPVMLAIAAVGPLGAIAVARYVSRRGAENEESSAEEVGDGR